MSRFDANLQYFKVAQPALAQFLASHRPSAQFRLIRSPLGWNVEVPGGTLYQGKPADDARAKLERFLADPLFFRVRINKATLSEFEPEDLDFIEEVGRQVPADLSDEPPWPGECRHYVLWGMGLGHELTALIERKVAREVMVIEPFLDLFHHSCHVQDWAGIFARAEAEGVRIHLFFGGEPEPACRWMHGIIRSRLPGGFCNMCIQPAYPVPLFEQFLDAFRARQLSITQNWGFMLDELIYLRNTALHLADRPRAGVLASPARMGTDDVTAVVVGSGPSLTRSLDALRALKGRAAILSCGTSLRILMTNGIVPDFHVEIERDEVNVEAQRQLAEEGHALSEVPLLLSTNGDPRLRDLFGETFFYLRGGSMPQEIFSERVAPLDWAGPDVDHAAMAAALALGARRVLMLGTDMGSRDPVKHHADGNAYETLERYKALAETEIYREQLTYDETVPGNFGGTIHTNRRFLVSKARHEDIVADARARTGGGVRVFNGSDGARIAGADPVADPLALAGGQDAAAWIETAKERMRALTFDRAFFVERLESALAEMAAGRRSDLLAARLDAGPPGHSDLLAVCDAALNEGIHPAIRRGLYGNLNTVLAEYLWQRTRLADSAGREALDRWFAPRLLERMRRWEDRLADTFRGCVDRVSPA